MSFEMQRAFYATDLPPTARFVAVTLAWHHNAETGRCDPSVALLSRETGLCERAVHKALRALESAGAISVVRRTGSTPLYRLNPCTTCTPAPRAPLHHVHPTPALDAPPPLHHVHPTPALDAPKQERTGRVNRKEPESFASAPADAGNTDSLFLIEPIPPKPKRGPKPKPEETTDPRLKPIKDGLAPVFEKTKGREFDCDWKKTVGAIRKFLESRSKVTPDEFLEVWSLVCKYSSSPFYPKITDALDVAYLCRNYETVTGHIERAYHSESQSKR